MENDKLYTIDDIRKIFSCGRDKAYNLVHSSGFPKIQIGRTYYVVPSELDRWLCANTGKQV